jgi:protein-tyrosine phosphatase
MAEGIMRDKAACMNVSVVVDSAGTSDWHEGERPDARAIKEMRLYGIDISGQRSRPFKVEDFERFDHILVMDTSNQKNVLALARSEQDRQKVELILGNLAGGRELSVPDPYYDDSFETVYQLLDEACGNFLDKLVS